MRINERRRSDEFVKGINEIQDGTSHCFQCEIARYCPGIHDCLSDNVDYQAILDYINTSEKRS